MSYQNCNQPQPCLTQRIMEAVFILNKRLEQKNITVRFNYEDSLHYRNDSTILNYFSQQKIKHYGTARSQVIQEYEKLGREYYTLDHKKKFFSLQFLLDLIDKVSLVQMKIAEGKRKEFVFDRYDYPVRLTYKDESCIIENQEQYNNFMNPRLGDHLRIPFDAESIKIIKIKSTCPSTNHPKN